jgi:hypothetical protein
MPLFPLVLRSPLALNCHERCPAASVLQAVALATRSEKYERTRRALAELQRSPAMAQSAPCRAALEPFPRRNNRPCLLGASTCTALCTSLVWSSSAGLSWSLRARCLPEVAAAQRHIWRVLPHWSHCRPGGGRVARSGWRFGATFDLLGTHALLQATASLPGQSSVAAVTCRLVSRWLDYRKDD